MLDDTPEKRKKVKVLLAEDDDSMRRFLEVVLNRNDYETLTAKDGLEALEIALSNEIDIVVTDAVMPNMTGYDLCRILRQNPEKKHLPLIILSGFNQQDRNDEDKCLADFYLMKDNHIKDELIETLKNLDLPKGVNSSE